MKRKVSIQGFEGCFHQVAAQQFYGNNLELVCCSTFKEVVKNAVSHKHSGAGVIAIENSIVGSILPNYNLIIKSNVKIVGEVYLPIKQHLMVNPGVKLSEIKEVHSHYMAIQQCNEFLDHHDWKLIETEDTALSAKHIHQHKNKHAAAIAGKLAAEIYKLDIIAPNIHTQKNNYTRFLMLQHSDTEYIINNSNKASVNFITDHSKGSLAKVLTIIAENGINLSKLQSMPIPGSNFAYSFHADMEFEKLEQFYKLVEKLQNAIEQFKILGIYKNNKIQ